MKHIDLTGQRYGKLVVLSQLPKEGRYYRYLCKCDCGNTIEVRSENLRSGKVKSCGCLKTHLQRIKIQTEKMLFFAESIHTLKNAIESLLITIM